MALQSLLCSKQVERHMPFNKMLIIVCHMVVGCIFLCLEKIFSILLGIAVKKRQWHAIKWLFNIFWGVFLMHGKQPSQLLHAHSILVKTKTKLAPPLRHHSPLEWTSQREKTTIKKTQKTDFSRSGFSFGPTTNSYSYFSFFTLWSRISSSRIENMRKLWGKATSCNV